MENVELNQFYFHFLQKFKIESFYVSLIIRIIRIIHNNIKDGVLPFA